MGQIKNIKLHIVTDIKYKMTGRRSEIVRNKIRKKLKKKFLLTSKKCWLIEQSLLPLYQHLVEGYSEKLRDEWKVKVEESDTEATTVQVKEEPEDDQDGYMLEFQSLQPNTLTNTNEVSYREMNIFYYIPLT